MKTAIDHCIDWNLNKARYAKNPRDKARYLDNVENLKAYKGTDNANNAD